MSFLCVFCISPVNYSDSDSQSPFYAGGLVLPVNEVFSPEHVRGTKVKRESFKSPGTLV